MTSARRLAITHARARRTMACVPVRPMGMRLPRAAMTLGRRSLRACAAPRPGAPCVAARAPSRSRGAHPRRVSVGSELHRGCFALAPPSARRGLAVSHHAPRAAAAASSSTSTTSTPTTSSSIISDRSVVDVLKERGLLDACTNEDGLRAAAAEGPLAVYCGFDPTADSLHLGNLLGIVVLAWFQRCGHRPVALLGGATGRVGDPSGKSAERPALDDATVEKNTAGIEAILVRVLANSAAEAGLEEENRATVMNNLDWFGSMGFLEFLRDVGKHARVGTMMAKDSVKTRLESDQGMSFTEFTYQLLQGYDFAHLYDAHGVRVQVGGSDQWGNITAGTDLVRKTLKKEGAYGATFPLLVKSDGKKFGKSEEGAVWLSPERLSPYKFYQHMLQSADADVVTFMKRLTFMDMEEISRVEREMGEAGYVPNTAQRRLAEEVTRFVHGAKGLEQALKATEGLKPGSDTVLDAETLESLADDIPCAEVTRDELVGRPVVDVMAATGLQKSKGEAKRMVKGGGARVNNVKVTDEEKLVEEEDVIEGRVMLLAAGKKNKLLVRVVG